jgi:phytoene dehydrogenase-like protein
VAKAELIRLLASAQRSRPADLQGISLQDWLARQTRHPQVHQVLLAAARLATYTYAPDLLPAGLAIAQLSARVWYLDGGWQTLVDGLQEKAREAGARIVSGARVQAIEPTGEEGYSVHLADGTCCRSSAVVLAIDPAGASALVRNGGHESLSRWAEQAVPSHVACLDVALRRPPSAHARALIGVDRPLYMSVHSAYAHLAPQGSSLLHLIRYLRPGEVVDAQALRQEMEALLDLRQPGWRADVVEQFFLPHMVACNAIVQTGQGGLPARPGPHVPGLPDLYVAGDWVGPQGILADACFASARSAAGLILARQAARPSAARVD